MIINCNEGDECILFCLSKQGCQHVEINGCDNIYVDCDDDFYVCPTINNNCITQHSVQQAVLLNNKICICLYGNYVK